MDSLKLSCLLALVLGISASADYERSVENDAGCYLAVTISLTPPPATSGQLIEEQLPAQLSATNISHGGAFFTLPDGSSRIRWVFIDGLPRTCSYTLSGASGQHQVSGNAQFGDSDESSEVTTVSLLCRSLEIAQVGRGQGTIEILDANNQAITGPYENATQLRLVATASQGSRFVGWSGAITEPEPVIDLVIDAEKAITARFEYSDIFQRTISDSTVSLRVSPPFDATASTANAIEDPLPPGLTPSAISDGGEYNALNHSVRWFYFGDNNRTLTYTINGIDDRYLFSATAQYNDQAEPTGGDRIALIHSNSTPPITLTLPTEIWERDGLQTNAGIAEIPAPRASDLIISLTVDIPAELSVPSSIIIVAGQTRAHFHIQALDDPQIDGPRLVLVRAAATGYLSAIVPITVNDDDATFPLSLDAGWNIISIPIASGLTYADIFTGTGISPYVFAWTDNAFIRVDAPTPGVGHWLFVPRAVVLDVTGARLPTTRLPLRKGWNLVGPTVRFPDDSIEFADAFEHSDYADQIWRWSAGGFIKANSFTNGRAYWVYRP